ncbi:MAG: extracellular solute-binding protein [Alphaproteobacteria bacterium]|nr:extracellular solute-binding protein [Alphaproteobacteria bacterium]
MNQQQFGRRLFLQGLGGIAAAASLGRIPDAMAAEEELKFWAPGVAKVGGKDFSVMGAQAGISINHTAKSARADEAIQKMVVGDGQKLFDAMTDNGGGMEDALAENGAIVALDTDRISNWGNMLPVYQDGGAAADTIRYEGKVYAVPYLSNADSMAYNYDELGFHPDSWGVMFDPQFKGYVALQNDRGPTLTNTAIYLQQSGKVDIVNPSDMTPDEVKAVCQFLIDHKKKGQFRTFWDGFMNGVDLFTSREVVMASCWEPIQLVAQKKGVNILYGTMKEGHQTWNNVVMLTKGGVERGADGAFYKLADLYLSPWFGARTLNTYGFAPQMVSVEAYLDANPDDFDADTRERLKDILARKANRYAVKGNAWQNVFPTNIRAYQDWWSRVQAA